MNIPALIRPFYPQIQRTFVKNLSDLASQAVRTRAGNGLAALMAHQPRIDPLITELLNGISQSEESEVRDSFAATLPKVILSGGKNISPATRASIVSHLEESYATPGIKGKNIAGCLGRMYIADRHFQNPNKLRLPMLWRLSESLT